MARRNEDREFFLGVAPQDQTVEERKIFKKKEKKKKKNQRQDSY